MAMESELKRKLFHFLGLLYVGALFVLPRRTYLISLAILLGIVTSIETLRLKNPAINDWLLQKLGGMARERELRRFSGIFWLLAGVTLTVAMTSSVALAATALLYVILGDAAASLAGIKLGGPHWPKSSKRVSGSLACLVVSIAIGVFVLRPESYGWVGILVGALTATAVEAGLLPGDDNFSIPVASAMALLLSYGMRPFG